jgi:ERCC4-type nuclease
MSSSNNAMTIKVDARERDLIELLTVLLKEDKYKGIELVVGSLPLGDVILSLNQSDKLIIERKTINDLASSIKDGRYAEQSFRLNGVDHPNHNIIYLIEGDLSKWNTYKGTKMDKSTIYSALISINYYKGFSVHRSISSAESATIICCMANKLRKDNAKVPYYCGGGGGGGGGDGNPPIKREESSTEDNYVSVVKRVKRENITEDNIGELMLCQIPGVSDVTALAIMSKYKTIPELISNLKENKQCLEDIRTTATNRRLNKSCVENIIKFLHV